MKTVKEILALSEQFLKNSQIERPRFSAEEILSYVLACNRLDLYMQFDRPVDEEELERVRALLKKRSQKIPFPYLAGHVSFYDCDIEVNSNVLIPRPETEILVDLVVKDFLKKEESSLQGKVLWDLCTGSGCIAIAIKKRFPMLKVIASDLSKEALLVAKRNAEKNNVSIEFRQGDFLNPFKAEKADLIISNPPYISQEEYLHKLSDEVKNQEPKIALVADSEGFAFYQRLARDGSEHLMPAGKIFLEIGCSQGEETRKLFSSFPNLKRMELLQDWGGHDRFFFLEIE